MVDVFFIIDSKWGYLRLLCNSQDHEANLFDKGINES